LFCGPGTNNFMILVTRRVLAIPSSLYSPFSQLVAAIRLARNIHKDMIALFMNVLAQLMRILPVFLAVMLLLASAGFGFFIIGLRKRDVWEEEDEVSAVRRRHMTMLACIGVDLFVIAYVSIVFFLFQFLVDHVDLLR